jgi:hypothetical protein|tara:strand:- start:1150 stop:1344 length:195 start_codon:yes stop_codon:yes gene_type:complete
MSDQEKDWDEEMLDEEDTLPGLQEMLVSIAAETYDTHNKFWYADNITEEQRNLYMYLPRSREEH